MKSHGFLLVAVFGVSVGLVSNATAGPAVSSGPAQPDSGSGGVYAPATQIPSGVSPGLNARDSVAGQSGADTQSSVTNSGTNSSNSSSTTTQNPFANSYSNGDASGNITSASTLTGHNQEKVVELSDKELAAEMAATQEKSEVTKKFEPSILNQGIDETAKPSATSKGSNRDAVNPVTGGLIQSSDAPTSRRNPADPSPSAAVIPRP